MQPSENLVWGDFCQGGILSIFFFSQSFFVRPGKPFLRPDPQSRRAGAHRSSQGWARSAPPARALVLDGFEHDGTLVVVGMTKVRGEPRVW